MARLKALTCVHVSVSVPVCALRSSYQYVLRPTSSSANVALGDVESANMALGEAESANVAFGEAESANVALGEAESANVAFGEAEKR